MSMFTLEEMAVRIQRGEADLMPQLWAQTENFIRLRARTFYAAAPEPRRFELSDLIQSGFLAAHYAAVHYDPERGAGFLGLVDLRLKTEFALVAGIRKGRAANDAMNRALEGDAPTSAESDVTLLDTIPAPGDAIAAAEDRLYLQQLHEALESALGQLPEKEQTVIRGRYYLGQTGEQLGAALGCTAQNTTHIERRALRALYAARRLSGLEQFVDAQTRFYSKSGVAGFQRTHTSVVERTVIERDELRRRLLKSALRKL